MLVVREAGQGPGGESWAAMTSSSSISSVIQVLSAIVPRSGLEDQLAQDVRRALEGAGIPCESESELRTGRVDLRVGPVAIELKVSGTASRVLAQLTRYAKDPTIESVVLVTASAKHLAMPETIEGKPLQVVYLPRL
jgi:hypothetical protein